MQISNKIQIFWRIDSKIELFNKAFLQYAGQSLDGNIRGIIKKWDHKIWTWIVLTSKLGQKVLYSSQWMIISKNLFYNRLLAAFIVANVPTAYRLLYSQSRAPFFHAPSLYVNEG